MKTVYLISGPLGVGKSSVSRELANTVEDSELVVGDDLYNLQEETSLEWEQKLKVAWSRILSATKLALARKLNVVVDFVVEDELGWFCEQVSSPDVAIKYVVLVANKETILERLEKREELKFKDRSLFLLEKLRRDPANANHLCNTTAQSIAQIVDKIIENPKYFVNKQD